MPAAVAIPDDAVQQGNTIVWIEQHPVTDQKDGEKALFTIHVYDSDTKQQQELYVSRSPVTHLSLSWGRQFVGWIENHSLYTISLKDRSINRIVESVDAYAWSLDALALAYTSNDTTLYSTIDTKGTVTSSLPLVVAQPMYALKFIDEKTLYCWVRPIEDKTLLSVDLQSMTVREEPFISFK
ncbi:MAG TPA: hypothetical protein VJB65_01145 [Patescibacteria group bacterium]|nr:hypothetical protein [Patescibacteria group bacterium]